MKIKKFLPGTGFVYIIFCLIAITLFYTWVTAPIEVNRIKKLNSGRDIFFGSMWNKIEHFGFGNIEGPYQEKKLPKIRWGLGPQSEVTFSSKKSNRKLIFNVCNSLYKVQKMSVFINGLFVKNIFLKRRKIGHFQKIELSVKLISGKNKLVLKYSNWYKSKSNRKLAVLFSHIEIK